MKLSDYKGEAALDVLADIIEPLTMILADEEMQKLAKTHAPTLAYVKPAIKNHKQQVFEVLARLENEPVEEFKANCSLITLPKMLLDLFNDPEVQSLFTQQVQTAENSQPHSGSVTAITEAKKS